MNRRLKPRLRPESYAMLLRIGAYITRYNVRGERALSFTASDVLDGDVTREDVDALVRARLLSIERFTGQRDALFEACGSDWSVRLTPRAMRLFWPDRLRLPVAKPRRGVALRVVA